MLFNISFLYNLMLFACVFAPVVLFHELGHYFFARMFNIGVAEFAIGFGQKVMTFKDKRLTEWSIRLLPFGGFIRVIEDPEPGVIGDAIHQKHYYQRVLTFLGGPLANFLMTFILVIVMALWTGIPNYDNTIGDTKYSELGLRAGDKILKIDNQDVKTWREVTLQLIGKTKAQFTIERSLEAEVSNANQGEVKTDQSSVIKDIEVSAKVVNGKIKNNYEWGIEAGKGEYDHHNFFSAVNAAFWYVVSQCIEFGLILKLVATKGVAFLSGPVGMFKAVSVKATEGIEAIMWFIIRLSMSLGLFNLLPFPLLDGGRIFIATIERIRGKNLSDRAINYWGYIGLFMIGSLFAAVTLLDLLKK